MLTSRDRIVLSRLKASTSAPALANTIVFSKRTRERLIPMKSYKRESIVGRQLNDRRISSCQTNLDSIQSPSTLHAPNLLCFW